MFFSTADVVDVVSIGWPVALSTLSYPALQIVDLAVVGHAIGAAQLSGCTLGLLVANFALEPSCFVLTNAVTTLCAGSAAPTSPEHASAHLRGAVALSVLLTVPLAFLLLGMPAALRSVAMGRPDMGLLDSG